MITQRETTNGLIHTKQLVEPLGTELHVVTDLQQQASVFPHVKRMSMALHAIYDTSLIAPPALELQTPSVSSAQTIMITPMLQAPAV